MDESDSTQRWYVAVLIARATVGEGRQDEFLLDHQVRLIRARDAEEAHTRALALGEAQAHSYRNEAGESVLWEFVGLADLDEVQADQLSDGVEVYSWRTRGQPPRAVVPKEKLTVFWHAQNAHRPVRDLLD